VALLLVGASGNWDTSPPPIAATATYPVSHPPAMGHVPGNGMGGHVVLFDLVEGGQRRVQGGLLPRCPRAAR
jgi:hypothetical protein